MTESTAVPPLFCYQCEQTGKETACTTVSNCGKSPEVAALQDLLVFAAKGIATVGDAVRPLGVRDLAVDRFLLEALFTTVTNVNFDAERMQQILVQAGMHLASIKTQYRKACAKAGQSAQTFGTGPAAWEPADSLAGLIHQGANVGIKARMNAQGEDITGLQELLTYGLKGAAAYAHHAMVLGEEDERIYAYLHEALAFLAGNPRSVEDLLAFNLRCGEVNLIVMEALDRANTGNYGTPTPTEVPLTPVAGKAIVVSGHDLKDLQILLEQTAGKGVNVYTHGEMLPAHGYPELKKHPHFVGHFGGAWQSQKREFAQFPGAIVMTTNCLIEPKESYRDRLFTCGPVAWPGIQHIADRDFTPAIKAALAAEGFGEPTEEKRTVLTGFGHGAVLGVADTVIDAVKSGAIKRFFVIGGCDGAKPGRNYFSDFADNLPGDTVVLTLGCGKFRFFDHDLGTVGGLPRLLDCGQCNDAYSAIRIASALAEAFGCGVNDLPLSLVISWFEQKAVAVLLTLLHLGITNIRLGPSLPAFVSPAVLKVLVDTFQIKPTTTVEADMEAAMAGA